MIGESNAGNVATGQTEPLAVKCMEADKGQNFMTATQFHEGRGHQGLECQLTGTNPQQLQIEGHVRNAECHDASPGAGQRCNPVMVVRGTPPPQPHRDIAGKLHSAGPVYNTLMDLPIIPNPGGQQQIQGWCPPFLV